MLHCIYMLIISLLFYFQTQNGVYCWSVSRLVWVI